MIGVFDSGIGGLTVLSQIHQLLPATPLFYVADQKYAPYGNRSEDFVSERSMRITQWLIEQGCSIVVVACNTATAIAIDTLRQEFHIPIVGVEPGVKPAALHSVSQNIAILATDNTLASDRYQALLEQFLPEVEIVSQGCTGLAAAIEQCRDDIMVLLQDYCQPLIEKRVDQVVLGCTHYPLVKEEVSRLCGSQVSIVDTSRAIAEEVRRRFMNVTRSQAAHSGVTLFSTHGSENYLSAAISRYQPLQIFADARITLLDL
jgi:glutamate racemase